MVKNYDDMLSRFHLILERYGEIENSVGKVKQRRRG